MLARVRRFADEMGDRQAGAALAILIVAGVIVHGLLGRLQQVPVLFMDELVYGNFAESIAAGEGAIFRGSSALYSLYPYALSPAWLIGSSVPDGYAIAKGLTATFLVLTVIPLWFALRRPVGAWLALIPCGVFLVGPWSADSSRLLTESLALPIVTSAVGLLWWALRTPERARAKVLGAFALVGIAALVRVHLIVLLPAFALAILIDAMARPRDERGNAVKRFVPELIGAALVALVGAVLVFAPGAGGLGIYESVRGFSVSATSFQRSFDFIAMFGVYGALIPPIAFVALVVTRRAWRDANIRSLLAIVIAMGVVLLGVGGWLVAGIHTTVVERYAVYLVPWLLAMPFLGLGILKASHVVLGTLMIGIIVALPVKIDATGAAESFVAAREVWGDLFGLLDQPTGVSIVLLTLVLGVTYAFCLGTEDSDEDGRQPALFRLIDYRFSIVRERLGGLSGAGAVGAIAVILILITAPISSWRWHRLAALTDSHAIMLPENLDWIDDALGRDHSAAMVTLGSDLPSMPLIYTEFFNGSLDMMYVQDQSFTTGNFSPCLVSLRGDGSLISSDCPNLDSTLLTSGGAFRFSLQGGKTRAVEPTLGRVITTAERPPRLRSIVSEPCLPATGRCAGRVVARLWNKKPSKITFTFTGGSGEGNTVFVNNRFYAIPVNNPKLVSLGVAAGKQTVNLQLSWLVPKGSPTLDSVKLDGEEIYALEG